MMYSPYYSLNTVCEFICLIVAIFCLSGQKHKVWLGMIVFLAVTFITETAARILYFKGFTKSNDWLYNIFTLFELAFTHWMFYHLATAYGKSKYLILTGGLFLLMCYLIELNQVGVFVYVKNTVTLMSVFFIIYGLTYYYLQLKDQTYLDLRFSAEFWWVAAVLFYYFGVTISNLFEDRLGAVKIMNHHLLKYIYNVLNIIFYSLWGYAFICKKWKTKIS